MTTWFTADQHFGHDAIRMHTGRPFVDVAEMDAEIIRRHNLAVRPGDKVYMLGDFTLKGPSHAARYLAQLHGELFIIPGGHDDWARRNRIFISKDLIAVQILDPLVVFEVDDGLDLTLCHYPMRSWDRSHYGMHHLHGHSHGTLGKFYPAYDKQFPPGQVSGWAMDVGVDSNDFGPVSLASVVDQLNEVSRGKDPAA